MSSDKNIFGSEEKMLGESERLSEALPPDFIDDFMDIMDLQAAKHNLICGDAFIPGNQEDVVH